MKKLFLLHLIFLLVFFQACGSLKKLISNDAKYEKLDSLQIKPDYELTGLRVDVVRQVDSCGKDCTTPRPYSPIGLSLGNGLFLDSGMNLSIDLLKYTRLKEENFKIQAKFSNGGAIDAIRDKSTVDVKAKFIFKIPLIAHLNDSLIHIEGGFLKSAQDIRISQDEISWDPHGIFGNFQKMIIRIQGSRVTVSSAVGNVIFEILQRNNEIKVFGKFLGVNTDMIKIVHDQASDEILISYPSLFKHRIQKFKKTKEAIYCYDENYWGFIIQGGSNEQNLDIIQMPSNIKINIENIL